MRVDVETSVTNEPQQGHARLAGKIDGQARRRRHRGDQREATQAGLLHELEGRAATHKQ
jgi:hypothetical protein